MSHRLVGGFSPLVAAFIVAGCSTSGAGGDKTGGTGGDVGAKGGAKAGAAGTSPMGGAAGEGNSGGSVAGSGGAPVAGAGGAPAMGGNAGTPGGNGGMAAVGGNAGAGGLAGTPASGGSAGAGPVDHFVYTGGPGESFVQGYSFNVTTGALASIGKFPSGERPGYLSFHPGGLAVYAGNQISAGTVQAWSIEKGTGKLTAMATQMAGGTNPVHVFTHPSGKWLFSSQYGGANVSVYPLLANGDIGAKTDTQPSGENSHQIVVDPSGQFVFAPCRGDTADHVAQFTLDQQTGKLTPNGTVKSDDPRHIVFHPSGKWAYLLNENPGTLVSFDHAAGKLSAPQSQRLAANEDWTAHIEITPDGKYVYASGRGTNRIYIYAVNAATGRLTAMGSSNGNGGVLRPRDFTLDRSGTWMIVANQQSNSLLVLKIQADGSLVRTGNPVPSVSSVQAVVVVPVPRP